jgi:hypothetical protein
MKLEILKEFQIRNSEMSKAKGGTGCIVKGTRKFKGQTWVDVARVYRSSLLLFNFCFIILY